MPSSSQPSQPPQQINSTAQWPVAWIIAVVVVLGFEFGLRQLECTQRKCLPTEWSQQQRLRDFKQASDELPNPSVLMLGDSLIAGFNRRTIDTHLEAAGEAPCIIAAVPGASVKASAFALEHLILPRMKPKLIVYELSTQAANTNGLRNDQQAEVIHELGAVLAKADWAVQWFLYDHWATYRQQWRLRDFLQHPWRFPEFRPGHASHAKSEAVDASANKSLDATPWKIEEQLHVFDAERQFLFGSESQSALLGMAALCKDREIDFVVVLPPIPKAYGGYWPKGWATFESFREELESLAKQHSIPVINLTAQHFPDSDFFDSHHLSKVGGRHASEVLIEHLKKSALLRR